MEKYKVLKKLVELDTIKNKENEQLMTYVEKILQAKGFQTETKDKNLVMSIGDNPRLGFLGHMDTVEFISGWNNKPHDFTIKDKQIFGLGTCDMKGGIAAMIDAINEIDFSKLKYGMKIYLTYDEEISFAGTYDLVNQKEKFPEVMIFGEPTNNKVLIGCKGLLECECKFKGKKVHSSTPDKGVSANLNAVKFIYEINEFYEKYIKGVNEPKFEVPYTTMNVGILNGGSAKNSVPAECYATFDFRTAKEEHADILLDKLNQLSEKYDCNVNVIEKISPFINEVEFVKSDGCASFMTEASLISTNTKIILGTGPVTAHEINEYITIDSYEKLIKQYKEIISKVCK
ncbi:MAG: M20/M25/M40 family metallo-hydrolase [Clostridia bacterium]|nr:M20/M25/M40 family metallo-hydrolase [Clostridia bacterium]